MNIDKKNILRARAKALAKPLAVEKNTAENIEVIEFSLANERYAIETAFVKEVHTLKDFTPLPCTPPFVFGIINIRGQIFSVVDIKKFFDLEEKGITDLNKVIILHSPDMEFGVLADAVIGVREIPDSEIQPTLPTLTGLREEYLKGITDDRTVVLDAAKLLTDKKIIVHEDIKT